PPLPLGEGWGEGLSASGTPIAASPSGAHSPPAPGAACPPYEEAGVPPLPAREPPACDAETERPVALPRIPAHQSQHDLGPSSDFGPSSASIAARYWRPAAPPGAVAGRLIRLRLPGPAFIRGATPPYALKRFLAGQGFAHRSGVRGRLADLRRAIDSGVPTIVLVRPAGGDDLSSRLRRHFRVLVGYDSAAGRFHFVDPGLPDAVRDEPGNPSVDQATFWREWHGGGFGPFYRRWFLPVRPRPARRRLWPALRR